MLFRHHAINQKWTGDYGEYFSSDTVRLFPRSSSFVSIWLSSGCFCFFDFFLAGTKDHAGVEYLMLVSSLSSFFLNILVFSFTSLHISFYLLGQPYAGTFHHGLWPSSFCANLNALALLIAYAFSLCNDDSRRHRWVSYPFSSDSYWGGRVRLSVDPWSCVPPWVDSDPLTSQTSLLIWLFFSLPFVE